MTTIPPNLDEWIRELAPRLGLAESEVPAHVLLDVARDVAHGAVRPGAPVSTFMIGYALGLGQLATPEQGAHAVAEALEAWQARGGSAQGSAASPDADGADTDGGSA